MTKVLHSDFGAKLVPRSVPTHLHCFTATARIIHHVIYNLVTMTTVIHSVVTRCESSLLWSLSQQQNQSMRIIQPFLVSFRLFFFSTHITPFADLFQFDHEFPKLIGCEWKFFVFVFEAVWFMDEPLSGLWEIWKAWKTTKLHAYLSFSLLEWQY